MKSKNLVAELFQKFERPYNGSLRKRWDRNLNTLLASGLFKAELCEPGKIWPMPKGKRNVRVSMPSANIRFYTYVTTVTPYDVLKCIGKCLQSPEGKAVVNSIVDLNDRCHRCGGEGYIKMFSHYCDGICFDCYGSGYNHKFKPVVEIIA